tara:strand:- start:1304 stop:7777 length:6474 start_codon:yes stop_codon:yes gene_type:complete
MRDFDDLTTAELSRLAGYQVQDTPSGRAMAIQVLRMQDAANQQEQAEIRQESTQDQFYRLLDQYDATASAIEGSDVLTPEQQQQYLLDLEAIRGTSQIGGFGSLQELGVPQTGSSPLEQPKVFKSTFDILTEPLLRTTSTGETVAQEEDAAFNNLFYNWTEMLLDASKNMDDADKRAFVAGGNHVLKTTLQQNPNLSFEEAWKQSTQTLLGMSEAPSITEEELAEYDPEVKEQLEGTEATTGAEALGESFKFQKEIGTELPMYSKEQFDYFKVVEDKKYSPEITAQLTLLNNPTSIEELTPDSYQMKLSDGSYIKIPDEVLEYMEENPLGGVVYSPELDLEILRKIKSSEYGRPARRLDISRNEEARQAMARVRAYNNLGNPDWKTDQEKRQVVLENIREFDEKGWITKTTATGGTADSTPYWMLRVVMSPINAVSALAYEGLDESVGFGMGVAFEGLEKVGIVGEADYLDAGQGTRAREEALTPKYKGLGLAGRVAENMALNKGFMGEAEAVADSLNLATAYSPYVAASLDTLIKTGGAMMDIGADPVGDLMVAAPKALGVGMKTYKAHKALYGAGNYTDALKAASKAGLAEVDLIQGTLKLMDRYDSVAPLAIKADSVTVTMGNNVADNLRATKILEDGGDYSSLVDEGLDQTMVARSINDEGLESQDAIRKFQQKLQENPTTKNMLEEYKQTDELLTIIRSTDDPTEKALRFAKRTNDLPKADVQQAKRAIKAAVKEGIGTPQQNLSRIYGRGIFFEVAGDTADLDNLVWLTRKTLVDKGKQAEFMALSSQSKAGKAMTKILNHANDEFQVYQRAGRRTTSDVMGQGMDVRPTETIEGIELEGLSSADIDNAIEVIEGLELPATLKQEIVSNMRDSGVLFLDDYNTIRSAITDRIARVYEGGATIQDINRLEGEAQQRMLEAQGTVYRDKKGKVIQGLSSGARTVLQTVLNSTIAKNIAPNKVQKILDKLATPIVPGTSDIGVQMRRVLAEHNQSMATLGIRTKQTFQDLLENNADIVSRYIDPDTVPDGLDGTQALGLMTVGERTIGLGKIEQANNLKTSIKFMVDNLFLRKGEAFPVTYNQRDRASGLIDNTTPSIWDSHGRMYIEQRLDEIADIIVDDPLRYWDEVQKLMLDLDDAVRNPLNRNRTVRIKTAKGVEEIEAPIVDEMTHSRNVDSVDEIQLKKKFGLIGLTTYYVAESNRVMATVMDNLLQSDFKAVNVENIVDAPVSQNMFEDAVRTAAAIIFDNNNVKATEYELFEKLKVVVEEAHYQDVIRNLDTPINIDKIDQEILKELRVGQKDFDRVVGQEYKLANKRMADRIKLELEVIREENVEKLDNAMKKFDRDRDTALRAERRELDDKLEVDLEKIPENKRKNSVIQDLRAKRDANVKQVQKKAGETLKKINKSVRTGKTTKKNAAPIVQKLKDQVQADLKKIRKDAETKINVEKAKYEKYAEDSEEVRNLKLKHAEDANKLNKPYVKSRQEYRNQVVNELNNELLVRKQQLFDQREQQLEQIMESKAGKESIQQAEKDLANLRTIEEKIEYLKRNLQGVETENMEEFDKVLDAIESARLTDNAINEVTDQVADYALTVLRNNKFSHELTKGSFHSVEQSINTLFKENQGFARALFGDDTFKQLKNELLTKTKAQRQRILVEALKNQPDLVDGLNTMMNLANEVFYTSVLGYNMGSHVRNIVSAPTIVYQTTGRLLAPSDVSDGVRVVTQGGRTGSKGYGRVAVRTPDGRVYTNGDIYNMLQKAGVRSQAEFIQAEMSRGGRLIREIDAMKDKNLSNWSESWLRRVGKGVSDKARFPLDLQTYEDMAFRSAVAIQVLREGGSIEEASAAAARSMFNYSDIDPDLNRFLRAAFVFTSFRIQNLKDLLRAFNNPKKLRRYLNILRGVRTTNALLRANNENKQLPYQMYYPTFAQNRIVFEINHYNDSVAFGMAPAIPAIDSMVELIGWTSQFVLPFLGVETEAKDINMFETFTDQLLPVIKEVFAQVSTPKYEASKAKPELVTMLQTYKGAYTPYETAQMLEQYCGGTVIAKLADPGDKNAVNGYVYPLTAEQRKRLYHRSLWTMLTVLGQSNLIVQGVRALDPTGTTHRTLSPAQRTLAYFGVFSVSEAKKVDVQQTRRMRAITSEMKRMQTGLENLEEERD